MVTTAAAPMPAIQPYKHGSVCPTEAMFTVPEKRLASVSYVKSVTGSRYGTHHTEHTQVMTAEKNPVQIDATAAREPCLVEKKVAMSAGNADPVKMPVML